MESSHKLMEMEDQDEQECKKSKREGEGSSNTMVKHTKQKGPAFRQVSGKKSFYQGNSSGNTQKGKVLQHKLSSHEAARHHF